MPVFGDHPFEPDQVLGSSDVDLAEEPRANETVEFARDEGEGHVGPLAEGKIGGGLGVVDDEGKDLCRKGRAGRRGQ